MSKNVPQPHTLKSTYVCMCVVASYAKEEGDCECPNLIEKCIVMCNVTETMMGILC